MDDIDHLDADNFSAVGSRPVLCIDLAEAHAPPMGTQAVIIGYDRAGRLPVVDPASFDLLITTSPDAPAPWVSVSINSFDAQIEMLAETVREWPVAAAILCQILRLSEKLTLSDALQIESLAYSTLLGGREFGHWRELHDHVPPLEDGSQLRIERVSDDLTITLSNATQRNTLTAKMRDALFETLANALDDPSLPNVTIKGDGDCFSTGGALWEFGNAQDLAEAHIVRTVHSCARLIDELGPRCSVHFHGACIGSGLEVFAAVHRRIAASDSWFQLPELRMGLIPGAGGTATVGRAIGRHRTAWMIMSGKRISAKAAFKWGLIHEIAT